MAEGAAESGAFLASFLLPEPEAAPEVASGDAAPLGLAVPAFWPMPLTPPPAAPQPTDPAVTVEVPLATAAESGLVSVVAEPEGRALAPAPTAAPIAAESPPPIAAEGDSEGRAAPRAEVSNPGPVPQPDLGQPVASSDRPAVKAVAPVHPQPVAVPPVAVPQPEAPPQSGTAPFAAAPPVAAPDAVAVVAVRTPDGPGSQTVADSAPANRIPDAAPAPPAAAAPPGALRERVLARSEPDIALAAAPEVPTATPDVTPDSQRKPPPAGVWERIFTGLVQPEILAPPKGVAAPEVTSAEATTPAEGLSGPREVEVEPAAPKPVAPAPLPPATAADLAAAGKPAVTLPEVLAEDPAAEAAPGFQLLAMTTGAAPVPPGSPGPGAALPVPQVAAQLAAALGRTSNGATELALSPEELGHVRLRLEPDAANPDRMVITISFERPETMDLFRRHAGELAEAIRAAGYSGADIGFGQQTGGDRSQGGGQPGGGGPAVLAEASPLSPPAARIAGGASLDLRL